MSKLPEFPKDFYKHCPKVQDAKSWHQQFDKEDEFDPEDYAECAFNRAGMGMECENCRKFLTRPCEHHPVDAEFLPKIEQFYQDLEAYDAAEKAKSEGQKSISLTLSK
tara:strand:- start:74 stop:397 length:324 start_codon:yes stop_codon:yes gene_type:complete